LSIIIRCFNLWRMRRIEVIGNVFTLDYMYIYSCILTLSSLQDKVIEYMYDFGDGWNHRMTVAGRAKATENITCVDGTGHAVGEDVNRGGWGELKAAYRAAKPSSEQREKV